MKYKVIKNLNQYNKYCKIHEELFLTDFKKDQDEIELLEVLIEDFDSKYKKEEFSDLNPVELLKTLLADSNLSQVEFSKQIKTSRQLVNDVLNYRRNISKELVIKLAKFFAMSQEAFSRPYDLAQVSSNTLVAKKQGASKLKANITRAVRVVESTNISLVGEPKRVYASKKRRPSKKKRSNQKTKSK